MDTKTYFARRASLLASQPKYRGLCLKCRQPGFACYCQQLRPMDVGIQFVILSHPIEVRRRIATGRIAHLSLLRSILVQGEDFSSDPQVNALIKDPHNQCLILYPKGPSQNLTPMGAADRAQLLSPEKNLVVFVIDGTWNTARKTMFRSQNLRSIPRICFTPPRPSQFRIRVQPEAFCYSTVEAIHHTIELLGPHRGFDLATGQHHHLLSVFHGMVNQQLDLKHQAHQNPLVVTGRRKRSRLLRGPKSEL